MSEIYDTKELPEFIFPINLNIVNKYQQKYPKLKEEYEMGTYQKGYFRGGSNIRINIITCKDKVFISTILQSYILHR